jgi:hypothetical protein
VKVKGLPVVLGVLIAGAVAVTVIALDRRGTSAEPVEVVFGNSDDLPEELEEGAAYKAAFTIGWTGPVQMRDGLVSVFASRRGDTSEDAPEDGWPLVCEEEFDDVVSQVRLACPFIAPGPGEFALQLEVRSKDGDVIGETIYTHLVVEPSELSVSAGSS